VYETPDYGKVRVRNVCHPVTPGEHVRAMAAAAASLSFPTLDEHPGAMVAFPSINLMTYWLTYLLMVFKPICLLCRATGTKISL